MEDNRVELSFKLTEEQKKDVYFLKELAKLEDLQKDILGMIVVEHNGIVEFSFDNYFFEKKKKNSRNAGAKRHDIYINPVENNKVVKYSDVMIMLDEGKKWKEIHEYLGMSQANYFRRLKEMKESKFYSIADHKLLTNEDYLKKMKKYNKNF